jgi:nitrite reductase/ring-hydroxylating ferredoxin subunit
VTENLQWHEVARTSDLSPGEVMYVEVGNDPVALINLEGEFFALTTCAPTKMRHSPTAR